MNKMVIYTSYLWNDFSKTEDLIKENPNCVDYQVVCEDPIYCELTGGWLGQIIAIYFDQEMFDNVVELLFKSMDQECCESCMNFVLYNDNEKPENPIRYSIASEFYADLINKKSGYTYELKKGGVMNNCWQDACIEFSRLEDIGGDFMYGNKSLFDINKDIETFLQSENLSLTNIINEIKKLRVENELLKSQITNLSTL